MNKRKLMLVAVALCMVAILGFGGTLAYLTDTDQEKNIFTVGNVDIDVVETFTQEEGGTKLYPGSQNAVQKEVRIKLEEGSEDSYVWYEYLIPAVLDSTDGSTGTNNIVHVNAYGYTWDRYRENDKYWQEDQTAALPENQTWDHDPDKELEGLVGPEGFIGTETIDGVKYNVYVVLYHGILSNDGEVYTTPAMSQVYLDAGVDYDNVNKYYTDKNREKIEYDLSGTINILVRGYAIQQTGFDSVYDAYKAYVAQYPSTAE